MRNVFGSIAAALFVMCAGAVYGQDSTSTSSSISTSERTRDIVTSLDKTKHKQKEKNGVVTETYVSVKNEQAAKKNPSEYSGGYEADGYRLDLQVAADGTASGTGFDTLGATAKQSTFNLHDARVEGALLTGTKVYTDGETRKFEAVFTKRTSIVGKNPDKIDTTDVAYGIGFVQKGTSAEGSWTSRVFLQKN